MLRRQTGKNKIIISGADKKAGPWLAFLLSLAVTGLGQVYCGKASRGTAFMLLRVIAAISVPCYSVLLPEANVAAEIAVAVTSYLVITIMSPIEALASTLKTGGRIKMKQYTNRLFYVFFAAASLCICAISTIFFFSCFSFSRAYSAYSPLVAHGDILIINKIRKEHTRGEMIFSRDYSLLRIIALPGETVSYKNRVLSINGSELHRSVYSEEELNQLHLTDNNVTAEHNGMYRYAVIPSTDKFSVSIKTGEDEYCTAADERKDAGSFGIITSGAIAASFEGVLISPSRKVILVKPQSRSR